MELIAARSSAGTSASISAANRTCVKCNEIRVPRRTLLSRRRSALQENSTRETSRSQKHFERLRRHSTARSRSHCPYRINRSGVVQQPEFRLWCTPWFPRFSSGYRFSLNGNRLGSFSVIRSNEIKMRTPMTCAIKVEFSGLVLLHCWSKFPYFHAGRQSPHHGAAPWRTGAVRTRRRLFKPCLCRDSESFRFRDGISNRNFLSVESFGFYVSPRCGSVSIRP